MHSPGLAREININLEMCIQETETNLVAWEKPRNPDFGGMEKPQKETNNSKFWGPAKSQMPQLWRPGKAKAILAGHGKGQQKAFIDKEP